ncbi:AraC family transcriptional regulator ligand-binding domain-containing protein [Cupriavidus sp. IDO]|uniref:AraC family transcriptional regulator ligand-binding domain-containing protein n=1 Tax=Cupriavidus sp. IDO TaxID=1539142 RepID=UPI0009E40015
MAYLVRSAALTDYVKVARSVGIDPYRHLRDAGIDRSALLAPDTMIPAEAAGRLLEASAEAAGIEDLGLRMAETRQLSNLGPLGFVMQEQPTLRKALDSVSHYLRLQNEALHMRIEEAEGIVIIREDLLAGYAGSMRQAMQLVLGVLHRTLSTLLGAAWRPRTICFTHSAPASLAMYARVFGAPVLFRQDFDGLVCQAADLEVAIPAYDPVMAQQVRRYLDAMLAQSNATMSDKVRKLVITLLPSGTCSVDRVAQHLGVGRRTVYNRLAQHGDSYLAIVDGVREDLVKRYIDSDDRSLSEVATLVGFSSLSAFSRWFGSRFGCSVSKWRSRKGNVAAPQDSGTNASFGIGNAGGVPAVLAPSDLPADPDAVRAIALEQNRLARALWEQLESLKHQVMPPDRAQSGASSERLPGQAELLAAPPDLPPPAAPKVKRARHTRKIRPS